MDFSLTLQEAMAPNRLGDVIAQAEAAGVLSFVCY